MRKKEKQSQDWIVKTFRIKSNSIFLYNFLEFYTTYINDISKDELFDIIVTDSMKYIVDNNIEIVKVKEKTKRVVKGFSIKKDTLEDLFKLFNDYKHILFKGEVIEFLIELYLKNNIKKQEALPFIQSLNEEILNIPDSN
jgi:hypothetical protein